MPPSSQSSRDSKLSSFSASTSTSSEDSRLAPKCSSSFQVSEGDDATDFVSLPQVSGTNVKVEPDPNKNHSQGRQNHHCHHNHSRKRHWVLLPECSINGPGTGCGLTPPRIQHQVIGRDMRLSASPIVRRTWAIERNYHRTKDPLIGVKKCSQLDMKQKPEEGRGRQWIGKPKKAPRSNK